MRIDLQCGVRARGGGAADHQRHLQALALHLAGDVAHFLQRRRDQAGQADQIGILFAGAVQDHLRRHHHAQIDHLEIVAGQHHANDIFADVVHIALHRRHDDLAVVLADIAGAQLLGFDEGQQVGHGLLHYPRRLHHLRQEHLAGAEQVADHVHAAHQRTFDHVQRPRRQRARFFGVGLDVLVDAVDQRVRQPLAHRLLAPAQVFDLLLAFLAFEAVGNFEQALGRIRAPVQHHVLDALAQVGFQIVVQRQRAGVDDAHVHAGLDRVVQEHHVDGLAHQLVAAERERYVGDAAGNVAEREAALQFAGAFDEGDRVVVVFLDAGRHREHVGVEDDVFGREADLLGQQRVGARADLDLALDGIGLAHFIERHHHHRGAVAAHQERLAQEFGFAFLHRDRVDDALALQALQAGLDDAELGAVDHHRDARDVGLGGDQIEVIDHRLFGVEHALVHVDVEHLRAVLHLLPRHHHRFVETAFEDQLLELRRAGDIGAFADVDEIRQRRNHQRF